ncbi:tRNA-dihydrouridine(20) synthase [NAD(P)+]-like [Pollicipes pollicipes]|uniref:tRNA-dihydrouridine(20) synthase [NAD(P)+]-like n=1 Tax=Pollicipes pollicipes TaxID=41117 RepID=UPI0018851E60|nr:tRNA-dihydrouridine(20) synthase [NAD(P)+]-like [Pollicipes pollicipes]
MDYSNKMILAPMVRVSTLPVRLLALQYGADIVFTEELVDWKLLSSVRQWNDKLGTVDYVDPADGTVTLRTCVEEKDHVILQMGTCDPDRALKVAQKYEQDIAGIDINMGCPKEFSIKGGMGAALLQQPEKVKSILTTLVKGANIPVTCKIRLLSSDERTLQFCRMVESCGVAALSVHGRTRHERPRHPVHEDAIRRVAEALRIPVVANGGSRRVQCRADAEQFRQRCGASSVMLARAAMWNLSVFRPDGPLPLDEVITRLLQLCVRYDHPFTQAKYTVQQMLRELQETPRGKRFLAAQTLEEICDIWGLGGACRAALGPPASPDSRPLSKRPRLEDGVTPGHRPFVRGHYKPEGLPKTLLHAWCSRHGEPVPAYRLDFSDKLFRAVVTVRGQRYASLWEKNKKFAEQGAALTCVASLGIGGGPATPASAAGCAGTFPVDGLPAPPSDRRPEDDATADATGAPPGPGGARAAAAAANGEHAHVNGAAPQEERTTAPTGV